MGRRGARFRPSWTPDSHSRLRLVIADRGQHEAAVLRGAAYGADQLAGRGGAGGDRRGASDEQNMRLLSLCLIFLTSCNYAAAADYAYTTWGAGRGSCGTWTNPANPGMNVQNRAWVLGFVSAFNRYGMTPSPNADIATGTDARGLLAWVDRYCREHPISSIAVAAEQLIDALSSRSRPGGRSN